MRARLLARHPVICVNARVCVCAAALDKWRPDRFADKKTRATSTPRHAGADIRVYGSKKTTSVHTTQFSCGSLSRAVVVTVCLHFGAYSIDTFCVIITSVFYMASVTTRSVTAGRIHIK